MARANQVEYLLGDFALGFEAGRVRFAADGEDRYGVRVVIEGAEEYRGCSSMVEHQLPKLTTYLIARKQTFEICSPTAGSGRYQPSTEVHNERPKTVKADTRIRPRKIF